MPADKVDKLVNGELLYKFVERYIFADFVEHDCIFGRGCFDRSVRAACVNGFARREIFKAAVREQTLFELERSAERLRFFCDYILAQYEVVAELFSRSDGISEVERICAFFEHEC